MAFKPLSPSERASIEAQVLLKAGTDLAIAEVANGEEGVAVTMAIENAKALAQALPALKESLEASVEMTVEEATTVAVATVKEAFPEAQAAPPTQAAPAQRQSLYIDDSDYKEVNKLFMHERSIGIEYGSQQSAFMDNQAIRKLFAAGVREFPTDYFVESLQGKEINKTRNGKCALGDFKIKRGLSLDDDGSYFIDDGEGTHPLAGKSGYFGGLQKNSPFTWGDRPDPIDPKGWLSQINA